MHDIGDEDKYGARCLLAKIALQKFDCHWDPATLGPRWTRSLTSFELFEHGKGLIIAEATVKCNHKATKKSDGTPFGKLRCTRNLFLISRILEKQLITRQL